MKFSGIRRRVDSLGRIVIPVDIRRYLGWAEGANIEITLFGQYLLLNAESDRPIQHIVIESTSPITDEILRNLNKLSEQDAFIVLELMQRLVKKDEA